MSSATLAQKQQNEWSKKWNTAVTSFPDTFAAAIDKEMMKYIDQLSPMPKKDALCRSGMLKHKEALETGGYILCHTCYGTDRDPIPWKEVMRENPHETLTGS